MHGIAKVDGLGMGLRHRAAVHGAAQHLARQIGANPIDAAGGGLHAGARHHAHEFLAAQPTNEAAVFLQPFCQMAGHEPQHIIAHGVAEDDAAFIEGVSGVHLLPFLYLGAKHMVTGYDHLLFLFGVIFFLYGMKQIGTYVSLFAIGHSTTMLAGVYFGFGINSYVIDAIIGFSVVYKALDNLGAFPLWFGVQPNTKVATLVFGLLHGFGLASKIEGSKMTTMDAVDRGRTRSVADQLKIQHGLKAGSKIAGLAASDERLKKGAKKADKGAERAIRALIAERYPHHGVIGEEYGEDRPDAEFVWVLDPVDGTRAFIAGLPLWTTLIGLRYQGRPVLGSIGQPYLDEVFIGHAGGSRLVARGQTRTLKARVELANPGNLLVPGMFVQMRFMDMRADKVLLIPTEAVIQTGPIRKRRGWHSLKFVSLAQDSKDESNFVTRWRDRCMWHRR